MRGATLRRAFGLELLCEAAFPSLPEREGTPADPTRVLLEAGAAGRWPRTGTERIVQEGAPGSPLERFAERHPEAGHRLFAAGFGEAIVSRDGRLVTGIPREARNGRFERLLVGRVLPWTALVRGLEVLHAAAVAVDGRAIVLIGGSGAGKTSLALRLVLDGAGFLTDDVLALDRGPDGTPRAHPGARVAGLRAPERAALSARERARLGPLRPLDDKAYASLDPLPAPLPIGAILYLIRAEDPAGAAPLVEPLRHPPAELLLASTFVLSVRTPERLANLLDLGAAIAAAVPQYRVRITPGSGSAATARAIREEIALTPRLPARRPGP